MPPPTQGPVQGILEIQTDPGGTTRIVLDPDNADITAGGNGRSGDLVLKNGNGTEVARLGVIQEYVADVTQPTPTLIASYVGLRIRTADGVNLVRIGRIPSAPTQVTPPEEVGVIFGGTGFSGTLRMVDKNNKTRLILGRDQWNDGRLVILAPDGRKILDFDPDYAALYVGAQGHEGDLILRDGQGQESVKLDGGGRSLRLGTPSQPRIRLEGGNAWLGGNGEDGDLVMFRASGNNLATSDATVHINGGEADMRLGGSGRDGDITLKAADGRNRIQLDAGGGNVWLGGNGADGDLLLFRASEDSRTRENASIHLDGDAGDIILRNADCAEEFDLAAETPESGTVMVIDDEGCLAESRTAYDRRVAGVVSGAGDYRPGIVLDRRETGSPRGRVALAGKAYCKVDARYGAVKPGDLLTTSDTPGHAMVAADWSRAFGTVIGKALGPLSSGTGLVPALITLQ